jgi:hypothetical protein
VARKFAEDDLLILREMAPLYDPDVPSHLNMAFVERSRELTEQREEQIHGKGKAFASRSDLGWVPRYRRTKPCGKSRTPKADNWTLQR